MLGLSEFQKNLLHFYYILLCIGCMSHIIHHAPHTGYKAPVGFLFFGGVFTGRGDGAELAVSARR